MTEERIPPPILKVKENKPELKTLARTETFFEKIGLLREHASKLQSFLDTLEQGEILSYDSRYADHREDLGKIIKELQNLLSELNRVQDILNETPNEIVYKVISNLYNQYRNLIERLTSLTYQRPYSSIAKWVKTELSEKNPDLYDEFMLAIKFPLGKPTLLQKANHSETNIQP